jgi:3,4-dihydroxy 2-butanone 4-phosphate synthase
MALSAHKPASVRCEINGQQTWCDPMADGTVRMEEKAACRNCGTRYSPHYPRYLYQTEFDMEEVSLSIFGDSKKRIALAIEAVKRGEGVLLVDDDNRENEGDLIYSAETITAPQMALLIRECSGIVCMCIDDDTADKLDLPLMVSDNTSRYGTAFTVSIEAKEGVTTGVSAADRVTTIRTAVSGTCRPEDLSRPGHVFPLRAKRGGVLERRGHTEGTVDLMRIAGFKSAGVLCELTNVDGTMAKMPEIIAFAKTHSMTVVSIDDIAEYRRSNESLR